jgi:hypothetical protein
MFGGSFAASTPKFTGSMTLNAGWAVINITLMHIRLSLRQHLASRNNCIVNDVINIKYEAG